MAERAYARYSVRHFLDDEARLLSIAESGADAFPDCIDVPDGRLLPFPAHPLREAIESEGSASDTFSRKYGPELGADHLERFRLVLEFIASHQSEMRAAGVAEVGETLAIREEFLDYLLNCDLHSGASRIPDTVLGRFLDEWGTRWI
jgi:hypothetical protein